MIEGLGFRDDIGIIGDIKGDPRRFRAEGMMV